MGELRTQATITRSKWLSQQHDTMMSHMLVRWLDMSLHCREFFFFVRSPKCQVNKATVGTQTVDCGVRWLKIPSGSDRRSR